MPKIWQKNVQKLMLSHNGSIKEAGEFGHKGLGIETKKHMLKN